MSITMPISASSCMALLLAGVALAASAIDAQAQAPGSILVSLNSEAPQRQLTRAELIARTPIYASLSGVRVCSIPSPELVLQGFVTRYPAPAQAAPILQQISERRDLAAANPADWNRINSLLSSGLFTAGSVGTYRMDSSNPLRVDVPWDALDRGETVTHRIRSNCLGATSFLTSWVPSALSVLRQYYGL